MGAIELFTHCHWFSARINTVQQFMGKINNESHHPVDLGELVKQQILEQYQTNKIALPISYNYAYQGGTS